MSNENTEVQRLIEQSVNTTSIVLAEHDPELAQQLEERCEGCVHQRPHGADEYWGTRDGDEWRVHLTGGAS